MLQILLRLLLWAVALALVLIWLAASAAVWIFEAFIAWRRKTVIPAFHMPRAASDAKFGRTAAAAVAIVAVLAVIGGSSDSRTLTAAKSTVATTVPDAAPTTPVNDRSTKKSEAARKDQAKHAAARRAAKARARRRAAQRRREREAAARTTAAPSACDPSYKGACLDSGASDYDCEGGSGDGPKYTGTVTVVGDDHFDLDRDGDGTGCD